MGDFDALDSYGSSPSDDFAALDEYAPAPKPAVVDMGPAARRARAGMAPGERDLTSEAAGTSAGPISTHNILKPTGIGLYETRQPEAPADASGYVVKKPLPGGGTRILDYPSNPNEMGDPGAQMLTGTALGMAAGGGAGATLRALGAPAQAAQIASSATEGAVSNKAFGGDLDTGAALGLLPHVAPPIARGVGSAGRAVAAKLGPNTEKAIKNARGWVAKDISGDIKGASTATARKQLADDAENAATIVLKDRHLDKAIDRAESGNLDRLQEAQGAVQERLKTIAQDRLDPHWDQASKALPEGGVRSADFVDYLEKRATDLRDTGLTSDAAEADALDGIAGRIKKAKNWGGGKQYDPAKPVQGGALDGMETGKAIALLEKQQTGPTAGALGDEIKRLRAEATTEGLNRDAIVPAREIQKVWADEAGNAYKSYGGIHGTAAFERKLDIASHIREFRDDMLSAVAETNPRVAAELRNANRDYSALKRIESVLDQRINHAKANAQGAGIPVGLKKAAKEIKHSPTGFLLGKIPDAVIAGKRAFDKWIARGAITAQQKAAVRKIFTSQGPKGPAIRAAVAAGVPSSIAMWAGRAADGGATVQEVASDEQQPTTVAEAP